MIIIRMLGSLDTVVRGMAGVWLIVSRDVIRVILTAILSKIIPGFASAPLVARIESVIDSVLSALTGWIDSMASGAASFIETTPAALNTLFDAVEDAVWAHTNWIKFLSGSVIPHLQLRLEALIGATRSYLLNIIGYEVARLSAFVWSVVAAVDRRLSLQINALQTWAQAWINVLTRAIQTVERAAFQYTNWAVTSLRIDVDHIRSNLIALITVTARNLTLYTDRTVQVARDLAIRISVENARTYTNQQMVAFRDLVIAAFKAPAAPSWSAVRRAETEVLKDFPKGAAAHTRKTDAIPAEIPGSLDGVIRALSATSTVGMSWILDAGVPLWRRLSTFGDTVDQMQDDSLIEGVLTLLAFAVLDPVGSAREASVDMSATLSGVVSGTIGSIFPEDREE